MNTSSIVQKADDFVFELLKDESNENLIFHDYKHSYDVVSAVNEIGNDLGLSAEDLELLQIAAWFHDVGYTKVYKGHEKISIEVAIKFLEKENYDKERIDEVVNLIRVTEYGVNPANLLEDIMCDADLLSIGSVEYQNRSSLLRLEMEQVCGEHKEESDWLKWEIDFLNKHKFNTKYAQLNYNEEKSKNVIKRQKELQKLEKKKIDELLKSKEKKVKTNKKEVPQRGIETMFRVTLRNHINLSAIADNKANLMLSVNAIIISIIISVLIQNYKTNPELNIPFAFLLGVSVLTIIFATLSTKPSVTKGTFTKEDVKNKKANLLFFGNFFNTPLDEFEWGINEMMKDKDFLYGAMIRDLHSLGKVLEKKYHYLRITYLIFMYGITISVILFIVFMIIESK